MRVTPVHAYLRMIPIARSVVDESMIYARIVRHKRVIPRALGGLSLCAGIRGKPSSVLCTGYLRCVDGITVWKRHQLGNALTVWTALLEGTTIRRTVETHVVKARHVAWTGNGRTPQPSGFTPARAHSSGQVQVSSAVDRSGVVISEPDSIGHRLHVTSMSSLLCLTQCSQPQTRL